MFHRRRTDLLRAENITFGYEPGVPVVECWTERVDAGEVLAVTGPSGCGKSTLLYILGIMLKPDSGEVHLEDQAVARISDTRRAWLRANYFGFVFQDAALDVTRSVLDNVLETALYRGKGRASEEARALELLEAFGVSLRANVKPTKVSGGQAQRIALCRALMNRSRVLLADEPTGNLDAEASAMVVSALKEQAASGAAVVVVTHDPELVEKCDRVVRL